MKCLNNIDNIHWSYFWITPRPIKDIESDAERPHTCARYECLNLSQPQSIIEGERKVRLCVPLTKVHLSRHTEGIRSSHMLTKIRLCETVDQGPSLRGR